MHASAESPRVVGKYEPAMHGMGAVLPSGQYEPVGQGAVQVPSVKLGKLPK